jgi:hypothetical protein
MNPAVSSLSSSVSKRFSTTTGENSVSEEIKSASL